jgi:hypothetical protein
MSDESNAGLSLLPVVLQSNSDTSRENVKPPYRSLSIISSHVFFWQVHHLSHAALVAPSSIAEFSGPGAASLVSSWSCIYFFGSSTPPMLPIWKDRGRLGDGEARGGDFTDFLCHRAITLLSPLDPVAYASPPILLHLLWSADGHGGNPRLCVPMKAEGTRRQIG